MRPIALLAALLLGACGQAPTVIDGSSEERFHESAALARRDLPVGDRLAFDAALKNPPGKRFGDDPAAIEQLARTTYDGMTAAQVVDQFGR